MTGLQTERLVEDWRDRTATPLSDHLRLEIAAAFRVGHRPGDPPPIAPGAPVPGCACPTCTGVPEDAPARRKTRPRRRRRDGDDPLPVEVARAVPILTVAERLGLTLRRIGRTWRGPCPIHEGVGPNFSALPDGGFRCWTCGATGDGIALWMAVRGCDFHTAVRELAGA